MINDESVPSTTEAERNEANELMLENTEHRVAHHTLACYVPDLESPRVEAVPAGNDKVEGDDDDGEYQDAGWELNQNISSIDVVNRLSEALEESPESVELKKFSGIALQRTGNFVASKGMFREVLESCPNDLVVRRYYANSLLSLGEWSEGLLELEKARGPLTPLQFEFCANIGRLWTGQDISGKHLVIVGNGRQSDQIQFSRYINELRRLRPHKIGFVCDGELVELMRLIRDVNRVDSKLFEPFDYFIPVESLPLRLRADSASIPSEPYLHCSERKVEAKRSRVLGGKPLLGICWRNHQPEGADEEELIYKNASNNLDLEPLEWHLKELSMDYDLVSLQQDLRMDERTVLSNCGCRVLEAEEFEDFENIAEWVSCLDAVIAVDSPIAHLAGALGVPGHILLPFVPDWKWKVEDNVSRWYPHLKIHKKGREHCWRRCLEGVINKLKFSAATQKAS